MEVPAKENVMEPPLPVLLALSMLLSNPTLLLAQPMSFEELEEAARIERERRKNSAIDTRRVGAPAAGTMDRGPIPDNPFAHTRRPQPDDWKDPTSLPLRDRPPPTISRPRLEPGAGVRKPFENPLDFDAAARARPPRLPQGPSDFDGIPRGGPGKLRDDYCTNPNHVKCQTQ